MTENRVGVVVGLGLRPGAGTSEFELTRIRHFILGAVDDSWTVVAVATLDRRAEEFVVKDAARGWHVPIVTYSARELAAVAAPTPSITVLTASGTASVAEAAALLASAGGQLIVRKRSAGSVTVAVAEARSSSPQTEAR